MAMGYGTLLGRSRRSLTAATLKTTMKASMSEN